VAGERHTALRIEQSISRKKIRMNIHRKKHLKTWLDAITPMSFI
jgi:hypothetical protein